jgi:YfiH family protein
VQAGALPALVCAPLAAVAPHLFTTRAWRLGTAADASDRPAWSEVAAAIGVAEESLVRARQVHGTAVIVAAAPMAPQDGDILLARNGGLAVAVQTADCVPILLADARIGAVAAVHAGWRGLSVRAPGAAVAALVRTFGCAKKDLLAAIGPAVSSCCYEVGPDVLERFMRMGFTGDQVERWFRPAPAPTARNPSMEGLPRPPRGDHWYFDAALSARDQLRMVGVPEDRTFSADLCTASHPDALCSYRRDGAPAGRLAAVIRPREA